MTDPADNPVLDFLLAVLTSVMAPALGNPSLARRAAQQAIEACQPQGTYELLVTGQILAFAMTALEALRLAAPQDVSPSMQLKLRGSANGLNRAARDTTRILDTARQTKAAQAEIAQWQHPEWQHPEWQASKPPAPEPPAPTDESPAEAPSTHAPPANTRPFNTHLDWAAAMNRVAAKLRANTPPQARLRANALPAASIQRTVNALWIDTLRSVAQEEAQEVAQAQVTQAKIVQPETTTQQTIPTSPDPPQPEPRSSTVASAADRLSGPFQPPQRTVPRWPSPLMPPPPRPSGTVTRP